MQKGKREWRREKKTKRKRKGGKVNEKKKRSTWKGKTGEEKKEE